MTADDFVKVVLKGSDKLRVDDIVLYTGQQELHGKGMLRIGQNKIEIDMTLNAGEKPPESRSGIFTKRDYWKLSGVIEDRLRFKCDHIGPVGNRHSFHELKPTGGYDSTYKIVWILRFDESFCL